MTKRQKIIVFAAAGGALGGLAWLPLGLAPALPLVFMIVLLGLREVENARDAVVHGVAFGLVRYAVAAHFLLALIHYSPLAIVFYAIACLFIVPYALMESVGSLWLERRCGVPRGVGYAVLYALGEFLRTLGDLSFPADLLAHAFGTAHSWLAWTGWAGPFSISLMIVLTGALLELAWTHRGSMRPALALAGGALLLWTAPLATSLVLDPADATDAALPPLRVGVVQPCASVEDKFEPARVPALWKRLERLSEEAAVGADLVVWPETARPGRVIWQEGTPFADPKMEELSRKIGVPILYGTEILRARGRIPGALYNGAALVHPDGKAAQWYGKQRLLPFAEGVPFAEFFGWDPAKRAPGRQQSYLTMLGNFSPGPEPTIFEVGEARIGVLICYEGMYPALARTYRRNGANALVVMTNDAWWGKSLFAPWHARMIAARAREADVPVVRAANTGVSSATDRLGRFIQGSQMDRQVSLKLPLAPTTTGATVYSRTGEVLVILLLAGIVAAFATTRLRASERQGSRNTVGPVRLSRQKAEEREPKEAC